MFTERPYPSLDREAIRGKTIRLFREPEVDTQHNRPATQAIVLNAARQALAKLCMANMNGQALVDASHQLGVIDGIVEAMRDAAAQQEKP